MSDCKSVKEKDFHTARVERPCPLPLLEEKVGYQFKNESLLRQALHHRSFVAEHSGIESNERLEFLGDAVLGIIITDVLFRRWPDLPEGALAKARAAVVSSEFLAEAAARYQLGDFLALGKGEETSGGREKPSILADALEALIGALYLDGGIEAAKEFVIILVDGRLADAVTGEGSKDYKTRLQEASAQRWSQLPVYTVQAHGPDHAKHFEAEVVLNGISAGSGNGRSKKQAEQAAARAAWEILEQDCEAFGPRGRGQVEENNTVDVLVSPDSLQTEAVGAVFSKTGARLSPVVESDPVRTGTFIEEDADAGTA